jgi:hypothetical protein
MSILHFFIFLFFCVMLDKYVLGIIMGKKWNKGGAGCFKKQKAHWGGYFTSDLWRTNLLLDEAPPSDTIEKILLGFCENRVF